MSVPRYESYRDSGIDWIGKVPANWEVAPLKAGFSVVGGATPKSDVADYWDGGIPWVTPGDLSRLETPFLSDTIRTISEDGLASCAATRVPAGSVILSTRAPIGSLGITTEPSTTNQGCKALVPRHDTDPQFLAYTLSVATTALNVRGKGTTFLELSGDELARFKVPLPSTTEQTAIVAFLDRETGKIDALVEAQRRLIELLKEKRQSVISHAVTKGLDPAAPTKDSGVEWLGEVPAHWEVRKLLTALRSAPCYGVLVPDNDPDGVPMMRIMDMSDGRADPSEFSTISPALSQQYGRTILSVGDLALSVVGTIGTSLVADEALAGVNLSRAIARLQFNDDCSPHFARWLFESDAFRTFVDLVCVGSAQRVLNMDDLRAVRFPFPSPQAQAVICDYLSTAVAGLEALASQAAAAAVLLQERRAALISAAVTGKIDVRGLAPNQAEAA